MMDVDTIGPGQREEKVSFQTLPAEIRLMILDFAFPDNNSATYDKTDTTNGLLLDKTYSAQKILQALLTSKTFHAEARRLIHQRTTFVIPNLFTFIPDRLSRLPQTQVQNIRHITFVADARHFRQLPYWQNRPFGLKDLHLETLTIALHRSSFWHYLFDFTADVVRLLRILHGVDKLVFVRNGALVKGSFRTWFNRLVGLIMRVDHSERFERVPAVPEEVWWAWGFEDAEQRFWLRACPAKIGFEGDEEGYLRAMLPLIEELRVGMEREEWNPDPRSRMLYY